MFQEIFWWCSGADTSVLRTCPADHSKYVGIGTVIFFTALMAFFSSFIAMRLVFNDLVQKNFELGWLVAALLCIVAFLIFMHYGFTRVTTTKQENKETGEKKKVTSITGTNYTVWIVSAIIVLLSLFIGIHGIYKITNSTGIAVVFALFWSAMIFFLDRFITNTMYSDGKTTISWLELRSALPRILISIFLGIVISAPLELKIFNTEIKEYIVSQKIESNNKYLSAKNLYDIQSNNVKDEINQFIKQKEPSRNDKLYSKVVDKKDTIVANAKGTKTVWNDEKKSWDTYETGGGTSTKKVSIYGFDKEKFDKDYAAYSKELKSFKDTVQTKLDSSAKELDNLKKNILDELRSEYDQEKDGSGLYERLAAMHNVAMKKGQEDGYKQWELSACFKISLSIGFVVFLLLLFLWKWLNSSASIESEIKVLQERGKNTEDSNVQESIQSSVFVLSSKLKKNCFTYFFYHLPLSLVLGFLLGFNIELIHYIFYYLTTPIGLIMFLFILIDVSPVFYKMMLADGRYDKILHQDKLLEQDLIRVRVAKTLQKVNESELSSLSPFIFGNTYDKIKKLLAEKVNKDRKAVDLYDPNDEESQVIQSKNRELFEKVLGMKYRIAYASYAAWYRNMYDLKLGYTDTEEGTEDNPETIKNKCVLSFRSVPEIGGNIKVCPDDGIYTRDSTIHITAEANEGFKFAGWRDDATAAADREILVVEDKIYVAFFEKEVKQQGETA